MSTGNVELKLEVIVIAVTDVDRARAFYERWGFVPVGVESFLLGSDEQTDVLMQLVFREGAG